MKLLTYISGNEHRVGALIGGDFILDLNRAFNRHLGNAFEGVEDLFKLDMISLLELGDRGLQEVERAMGEALRFFAEGDEGELFRDGTVVRLCQVKLAAPIPRPRKNIVCLGLNYPEHVAEGSRARGEPPRPLPEVPVFFTKPPTSVIGPYDNIIYPRVTERLDYEVELAFVIGRGGKYIPRGEAYRHIVGYMVFNDVTARDLQRRHQQWFKGKGCDTFAPMGPYLVTADEVEDPMSLDLWLKVNGEIRQYSNTRNMIFGVDEILSILSDGMTVEVGDIVATGTPSGVGSAHPSGLLKVGDIVEAGVEKIGELRNRVVAEEPRS